MTTIIDTPVNLHCGSSSAQVARARTQWRRSAASSSTRQELAHAAAAGGIGVVRARVWSMTMWYCEMVCVCEPEYESENAYSEMHDS